VLSMTTRPEIEATLTEAQRLLASAEHEPNPQTCANLVAAAQAHATIALAQVTLLQG